MAEGQIERDFSWRWQTLGLESLSPPQRTDAQSAFDGWLSKYNRYSLGGFPVNDLREFIHAVQHMGKRPCGLEAANPSVNMPSDVRHDSVEIIEKSVLTVRTAIHAFLDAYRIFDEHFENIKSEPDLYVPMEDCVESFELDKAAWILLRHLMTESARLRRYGVVIRGVPVKHPFLTDRAIRYAKAIFVRKNTLETSPFPFKADAKSWSEPEREIVKSWIARFSKAELVMRQKLEASSLGRHARAELIRWLDARNALDAIIAVAEESGATVSATGNPLDSQQLADLRAMRSELTSWQSAQKDITNQRIHLESVSDETDNALMMAQEQRVLERLEEMANSHRAHAKFYWIRSFHFNPMALAEAELLAPNLIALAKTELGEETASKAGSLSILVGKASPEERKALSSMAKSSRTMASTRPQKGKRAGSTGETKAAAEGIVSSWKALGAELLNDIKSVLPSMFRQASKLVEMAKPTPIDIMAKNIHDWRLMGFADADRRYRRAHDDAARALAVDMRAGWAKAIVSDSEFLNKIREIDQRCSKAICEVAGVPDIPVMKHRARPVKENVEIENAFSDNGGFGVR